jgi:ABC-type enterochelin transport system ATPase subunit
MNMSQLAERIDGVKGSVDAVAKDVKAIKDQALDRRLSSLESTVTWLSRLLVGAVVMFIVAVISAIATR